MRIGSFALILLLWLAVGPVAAPAYAQGEDSRSRRALLDSLSRPQTSALGEWMVFDASEIDAGEFAEDGGERRFAFSWTNAGGEDVRIVSIMTTCACAVPEYSVDYVAPGERASFDVVYHPKGHPGRFSRRIMVYASARSCEGNAPEKPAAVLELNGRVTPAAAPLWNYPVEMGDLRLKRDSVAFERGQSSSELVVCYNSGEEPLKLGADTRLLPKAFSFSCTPAVLQPGQEGEIVISYDPAKEKDGRRQVSKLSVVLRGGSIDALPQRERSLKIFIGN